MPSRRIVALLLGLVLSSISLGAVGVSEASAAPASQRATAVKTYVSLTFDDSDGSQTLAEQALVKNGLRGTFYTMTGWVGTPGYLTRADLTKFASDGMEIGGHTMTHPDLNAVGAAEDRRQLCGDRATLQSWGFHPTSHAYPMSRVSAGVEAIAKQCGYVTARGGATFAVPGTCPTCQHAEVLTGYDPFAVRALQSVDSTWTIDTLKKAVTDAATGSGGWVVLAFHQICAPYGTASCPASQSLDPAVFSSFASWLASYQRSTANSTRVATMDDVARATMGSSYPAYSPATPVVDVEGAPGTNLLLSNTSLETTNSVTGGPDCFTLSGWGANTRTGSFVQPGLTGTNAYQVTVSGATSGDAKLLPNLDMGTCSATVTAGQRYTVTVGYQSTAPTTITTYMRDSAGRWDVWEQSPAVPASTGWSTATFTTSALPAGKTGMSFGLTLGANGSMTTDDYSVVRAG